MKCARHSILDTFSSKQIVNGFRSVPNFNRDSPCVFCRRMLALSAVYLQDIEGMIFRGFLQSINLFDCNITHISRKIFTQLQGLRVIKLEHNLIYYLDPYCFSGLHQLYYLSLRNNYLTAIPDGLLNNLPQLSYVFLDGNAITTFKAMQFSRIPRLTYISLSNNSLMNISDHAFQPDVYEFPALQGIDLSYNKLTDFPTWLLTAPYLLNIHLNNNEISFSGLWFVFQRVPITTIKGPISTTPKTIAFRNNAFTDSDVSQWDKLTFAKFDLLITMFLLDFGITFHCNCRIYHLYRHLRYYRGHNAESEFQNVIDYNTNRFYCFEPEKLRGLSLIQVPVNDLGCYEDTDGCPQACRCWVSVTAGFVKVDCSNQNLVHLPENIPDSSIELDFSNNKLVDLPADLPSYLAVITVLNLTGNNLRSINEGFFARGYNLSEISLDNNELTTLPRTVSIHAARYDVCGRWLYSETTWAVGIAQLTHHEVQGTADRMVS